MWSRTPAGTSGVASGGGRSGRYADSGIGTTQRRRGLRARVRRQLESIASESGRCPAGADSGSAPWFGPGPVNAAPRLAPRAPSAEGAEGPQRRRRASAPIRTTFAAPASRLPNIPPRKEHTVHADRNREGDHELRDVPRFHAIVGHDPYPWQRRFYSDRYR